MRRISTAPFRPRKSPIRTIKLRKTPLLRIDERRVYPAGGYVTEQYVKLYFEGNAKPTKLNKDGSPAEKRRQAVFVPCTYIINGKEVVA